MEEKMRGTILVICITVVLTLGLTGCSDEWSSEGDYSTTQEGLNHDVSGDYTLMYGEAPWDDIMIWQTGSHLRAQDSRGHIWEGSVSGTGMTPAFNYQVYLECQNQKTGLTEWMRGRILLVMLPNGLVTIKFEGIYTRSDLAETSWFEANCWYNPEQWPGYAEAD